MSEKHSKVLPHWNEHLDCTDLKPTGGVYIYQCCLSPQVPHAEMACSVVIQNAATFIRLLGWDRFRPHPLDYVNSFLQGCTGFRYPIAV